VVPTREREQQIPATVIATHVALDTCTKLPGTISQVVIVIREGQPNILETSSKYLNDTEQSLPSAYSKSAYISDYVVKWSSLFDKILDWEKVKNV